MDVRCWDSLFNNDLVPLSHTTVMVNLLNPCASIKKVTLRSIVDKNVFRLLYITFLSNLF